MMHSVIECCSWRRGGLAEVFGTILFSTALRNKTNHARFVLPGCAIFSVGSGFPLCISRHLKKLRVYETRHGVGGALTHVVGTS